MCKRTVMKFTLINLLIAISMWQWTTAYSQESTIQNLDFLIGTWEVREENADKSWWEETRRSAEYTLDSTYIELNSEAVSSSGKKRTYRWFIHFNTKDQQYEMISMFGNWHKVQYDILEWDQAQRTIIFRSGGDPGNDEYHDRYGEMVFNETFTEYVWTGINKSGDPTEPNIWEYEESGRRVDP